MQKVLEPESSTSRNIWNILRVICLLVCRGPFAHSLNPRVRRDLAELTQQVNEIISFPYRFSLPRTFTVIPQMICSIIR